MIGTLLRRLDQLPPVRTCQRCKGTGLEPRPIMWETTARRDCTLCDGLGEYHRPETAGGITPSD